MKRALVLLSIGLATTAGIVWYAGNSSMSASAALIEERTQAIHDAYAALVQMHMTPLEQLMASSDLRYADSEGMQRVQNALAAIPQTPVEAQVNGINLLQLELAAFTLRGATNPRLEESADFNEIQHEMSEAGDIRKLIDSYNDAVAGWNTRIGSLWGSIVSTDKENEVVLPFLKFDGSKEFFPEIKI